MATQDDIQRAEPAYRAAVAACVHDAYAHYVQRIGREPAPMCADYGALLARGVVYVLPEPAGGVRGLLVMMPQEGARFIENLAVHSRHQGRGLGSLLMAFAAAEARAAGLGELRLYTNERMPENLAYYGHLGYEEVAREEDDGLRRVFMKKVLG